jgi:TadE-like protein
MKNGLLGKKRGFETWGQRGQALVEFSLVCILFCMLSFGVFDLARLFQSWVTVQHASREAARYAITGQASCAGALNRDACIIWTAKHATDGLADGGPTGANVSVTTEAWDFTGSDWPDPGVPNATGKQCDQIEVTVAYKHKFTFPVLSAIAPNGVEVVGRQRMTMEPYGECDNTDGVSGSSTPVATSTPPSTPTPGPTATPVPPTATPTKTPVPPTATPSKTPTKTPTPLPPTATPTKTSTPTKTPTPKPPTATPTKTPTPCGKKHC